MDVQEYLTAVCSQINTVTIRGTIRRELAAHLEDQKETLLAEGMGEAAAEEAAVEEMGDPVKTGLALNEIHRPKPTAGFIWCFAVMNAALFVLNLCYIYFWREIPFRNTTGAVLMLLAVLGLSMAAYLGVVYASGYYTGLIRNERIPFGMPGLLAGGLFGQSLVSVFIRKEPFMTSTFTAALFSVFAVLFFLFAYRRKKKAWRTTFILIFFFSAGFGLIVGKAFLSMEITGVYAALYTIAYRRGWFSKKQKAAAVILWGIPAVCAGIGISRILTGQTVLVWQEAFAENGWDFSLLPEICGKAGILPAYLLLILGVAAQGYLLCQYRHTSNEWGKMFFAGSVLLIGILLVNGVLALHGMLPPDFLFSPFAWKVVESSAAVWTPDYVQMILYTLLAGYTARFVSRDSLLNLEIRQKIGA